jgi:hypothetical protein
VQAQESERRTVAFEGTELFAQVLHSLGMRPIAGISTQELPPKETLIVVFGDPDIVNKKIEPATGGLNRFLKEGGNLLIATDYQYPFLGTTVFVPGDKVVQNPNHGLPPYRQTPECPWLGPDAGSHPLFHLLQRGIATNCPSQVILSRNRIPLQPLLDFPPQINLTIAQHYMVGSPKSAPPHGRALFIAGHGMFMNGMMVQLDNDNFDFTVNAIRWLREKESGKRTRVLFVVDGAIITDFSLHLAPPLPTTAVLNQMLRGLEEERFFQHLLESFLPPHRLIALTLAIGTFVLLLYGAKKLMEGRDQRESNLPRV